MGWFFSNQSRAQLIAELTESYEDAVSKREVVKYCLRGNVLWSVVKRTIKETNELKLYLFCDILRREGEEWGHKPLDESMGPNYYTCPLGYLKMVPVPDCQYAAREWREQVILYHSRKKSKSKSIGK